MATVAQIITPVAGARRFSATAVAAGSGKSSDGRLDSDLRLIERCLDGEEAAWEEFVQTHTRRVYAICLRFTGNQTDAQDITQEVFLRLFRSLKSFRSSEGKFTVWLGRLTRNLLIDHYRRSQTDRVTDSLDDQLPVIESRSAEVRTDALLAGREAGELLQWALRRLSPDLRETVILRDLQGLDYREISEVLKVPEGTVKSRLNRGRAEMGRHLRRMQA